MKDRINDPPADEMDRGSPVLLFDGRYVYVVSDPETTEPIGLWAKVREVLNAKDPAFSSPDFGPEETVSLIGAVNALSKAARRRPTKEPS